MKITKQTQHSANSKKIIATICIIVTVITIGAIYLIGFNGSILGWQPFEPTSQQEQQQTSDPQDTTTNSGTKDDTDEGTDQTTDEIPVNQTLVATFTKLSQADGFITFTGEVNANSTDGSCSITFTNASDRPVTRTATPTQVGSKSVCGPVQIPESEFSFLGEWTATFRFYTGGAQTTAERKITIQ